MKETGYFNASDFDYLQEGKKVSLEHEVSYHSNDKVLLPLVNASFEDLVELRELAVAGEEKAFEQLKSIADIWEQKAALTMLIDRAISFKQMPQVEHTSNQWQQSDYSDTEIISNKVYKMSVSLYQDNYYDRTANRYVNDAWHVTWSVSLNTPDVYESKKIAGQSRKSFTDKDAALKYIEGRKKAYSHLFTEISPPIPRQYEERFSKYGLLLPGYSVEGKELLRTNLTAVEMLYVLSNGEFQPESPKASVLEKLSENKVNQTTRPKGAKQKDEKSL